MVPQRIHIIKRNGNVVYGFQQSAFGFLNKHDAHYIMHVLRSQKTRLVYYPNVASNKFKIHLGSGSLEPSPFLIGYNDNEYQLELLSKNMSIRVIESVEKMSGFGSITLVSPYVIDPDMDSEYKVGLLETMFMQN
jgi:hypothetical protein